GQIDLDIAGDDETFVEDTVENVDQAVRPRRVHELRQSVLRSGRCIRLSQASERSQVDVQILVRQTEDRLQLIHALIELQQRQAQSFDFILRERTGVHAPNC